MKRNHVNKKKCANEEIIMSSTGTPFDITGFRTEKKFENHDNDASKIDSISDSTAIDKAFLIFNDIDVN